MLEPIEQKRALANDAAAAEVGGLITRCFQQIEATRMAGIPILNAALRVEVVGLQRHGGDWLAVLITPWFMNIMLLPIAGGCVAAAGTDATATAAQETLPVNKAARVKVPGSKEMVAFAGGSFEMIYGFEAELGSYRMCSLFSPVLEFADQESAVAAAEAALEAILTVEADDAAADDDGMDMIWRGERPQRPPVGDETTATEARAGNNAPDAAVRAVQPLDRRALLFGRKAQGGAP